MSILLAQEVSDLLRIPLARTYELARDGILPCVRLGRQIHFDEAALRRWLEKGGRPLARQVGRT